MKVSQAEREVYVEAIRVIPGILAAKDRDSTADATMLLDEFMAIAKEKGLSPMASWATLFRASTQWNVQLSASLARTQERDLDDVHREMGMAALTWSAGE